MTEKQFVSQNEFAKLRGVSKGAVSKWKARGLLVINQETGNVDVAASVAKLDSRPEVYRGGSTRETGAVKKKPAPDETYDVLEKETRGEPLTHADATRLKEIFAARTQRLRYDQEIGAVVSIEEVGKQVTAEYSALRKRLLNIPAKVAIRAAALKSAESIQELVEKEINFALHELTADARLSTRGNRA